VKSVSIIVEFENATLKGLEELAEFVTVLKSEVTRVHNTARFELLCAYPGGKAVADLPNVQATLSNIQSQLKELAEVRLVELPGLRYYELKNEAAKRPIATSLFSWTAISSFKLARLMCCRSRSMTPRCRCQLA
jgi:hypothetical protein